MNNITLIGMPGSGKSTVGVLLAKALGFQFVDVDLLIQQREGALLQELLDNRGVEPFLDAEEAAVRSLACTGAVIAPGGSAVCRAGAIGLYRRYADLTVDVGEGRGLEETVAAVLQGLLGLNTAQAQG